VEIVAGGTRLRLLPQRAAYLPDAGALLVADAHLGKAASFRRLGVPVPEQTTGEALRRLDAALAATGAHHVVFLGDLLHSAQGRAAAALGAVAAWRERHPQLRLTLVRGNHDARAGDPPPAWGVHGVDGPLPLAGLLLAHEPVADAAAYVLAGHVHPAAVIAGRANDRLRLPCFHFGACVGVLPAFGAFTGMHVMARAAGDRVFVVAGDEVRALNSAS
jgi:uncharacterized protein